MTLEEKALKYLESSKINDPQHDLVAISEVMAEFSRIQTKAKLEEAVESLNNISIQQHIEQDCRHEDGSPAMDEQAFYEGAKWMRESITKTPLD